MTPLGIHAILPLPEYEARRPQLQQAVLQVKRVRRVRLGPRMTLLFENRDTIRYQIQEMMRVERIVDPTKIQAEVEAYQHLLPRPDALAATLLIEITAADDIRLALQQLQGIDHGDALYLEIGGERFPVAFETGHSREDRLSAVHYLRFPLPPIAVARLRTEPARLVVDHPNYRAEAAVAPELRAALLEDLKSAESNS